MANPTFDVAAAHRYFSADCFNKAWSLIEKPSRTPEEEEEMVRLNQASIWHWTQREDCKSRNLSIGYWQTSRIQAILGRADAARHYGEVCLKYSKDEPAFFLGYAHEALARAEKIAGNTDLAGKHLAEARRLAGAVTDPEERKLLVTDLDAIG
jgi:hypothetical protein